MRRQAAITGTLGVERRQFSKELASARSELGQFSSAMKAVGSAHLGGTGGGLIGNLANVHAGLQMVKGAAVIGAGAVKSFFKSDEDAAGMMRGLASVADKTESLATTVSELQDLAGKPGMDMQRAMVGYANLRRLGLGAKESRDWLEQFGNEIARLGKSGENFDSFMTQLGQSMSTKKVELDELKIMAEGMPSLFQNVGGLDRSDAKGFFGGLAGRLREMPRAIETNTKKLEKMRDAAKMVEAAASAGSVGEIAGNLATWGQMEMHGEGPVTKWLDKKVKGIFGSNIISDTFNNDAAKNLAKAYQPSDSAMADNERRKKKLEDEMHAGKLKEFNALMEIQNDLIEAENNLLLAQANHDEEDAALLQARIDVLKEAAKMARAAGVDEEVVAAALREQAQARWEGVKAAREVEQHEKHTAEMLDLQISRLRERGRTKEANKLEDERDVNRMVQSGERTPEQAREFINERRRQTNDAATFSRFGRHKIYGRGRGDDGGSSNPATHDGGSSNPATHDGGMRSEALGIDGFKRGHWRLDESPDGPLNDYVPDQRRTPKTDRANAAEKAAKQPVRTIQNSRVSAPDVVEAVKGLESSLRSFYESMRSDNKVARS